MIERNVIEHDPEPMALVETIESDVFAVQNPYVAKYDPRKLRELVASGSM